MVNLNDLEVFYKSSEDDKMINGVIRDEGENIIFVPVKGGNIIYNPTLDRIFLPKGPLMKRIDIVLNFEVNKPNANNRIYTKKAIEKMIKQSKDKKVPVFNKSAMPFSEISNMEPVGFVNELKLHGNYILGSVDIDPSMLEFLYKVERGYSFLSGLVVDDEDIDGDKINDIKELHHLFPVDKDNK